MDKNKLLEELKKLKQNFSIVIEDIESLVESLEVKEIDLEKEVEDWVKTGPHTSYPWCTIPDAIRITAEYFFELGLKAQKGE